MRESDMRCNVNGLAGPVIMVYKTEGFLNLEGSLSLEGWTPEVLLGERGGLIRRISDTPFLGRCTNVHKCQH